MKSYTRRRRNKILQEKAFEQPKEQSDPNKGGKIEKVDSKTYIIKKKQ